MVDELKGLLAGDDDTMELDRAALNLATIEFPELDFRPSLVALDRFANDIADRCSDLSDGREFVRVANTYLFEEVGLRGRRRRLLQSAQQLFESVLAGRRAFPSRCR